jgi:hypothetical protein
MATNAISLNGTSQYARVDNYLDIDNLVDGTGTMELWFNQDASSPSYSTFVFSNAFLLWLETEAAVGSTGVNFGYQYSTTSASGYKDTGLWTNGNWVHIAGVFSNGQQTKVYINGSEISYTSQNTPSGTPTSYDGKYIQIGLGDSFLLGKVGGFFRLWKDVRTGTEINDNKSLNLKAASEDNLIINIKFLEGSGTYSSNEASAGNDLDFYNTPSWTDGPTITEKSYPSVISWITA